MKFANPRLIYFKDEILQVAEQYALNPDNLVVETFIPSNNAIFVETFQSNHFRIHVNLQEQRIISVKQLNAGHAEKEAFQKYTVFMK